MTAIWSESGADWHLLSPSGFADEAALHTLVERNPQLLPLAGSPRLTVLGREVRLGAGSADLLAVELTGRLAVIEVKLAVNAEARRAVIAQVLTYAAYLHGLDPHQLEGEVLARHLRDRGHASLLAAVTAEDQERVLDEEVFRQGLAGSLAEGRFRIVVVLDAAPAELVTLVGYLEAVTNDRLLIDLVTVSTYEVGGSRIVVPQRVEPERQALPQRDPATPGVRQTGHAVAGAHDFLEVIATVPPDQQEWLRRMADWAVALEGRSLAKLWTYHGKAGITTLLPYVPGWDAGLVTIYKDARSSYLQFWRSVFERHAPRSLLAVEAALDGPVGQGNVVRDVPDTLLQALTAAYEEAVATRSAIS
jgi:hypothetical protein